MAFVEVWQSCNGIFPSFVFVMAFLQVMKVVVAWIQLTLEDIVKAKSDPIRSVYIPTSVCVMRV
jgi:hypothetical protein